jgi:catechol 2,3-dioxygenase-like lactoylglutathione lyase family enzyme
MIDHVELAVRDLERSARFYDAVFHALGGRRLGMGEGTLAWGIDGAALRASAAGSDGAGAPGRVALRASGRVAVRAAWEAGIGAGGADAGPPGDAVDASGRAYAARLRDPDGLLLELVSR